MCLCFVSLCWQSAFVTCQKRQNVGKFDIKHSILTKKGPNLALFWSKLYKHIILQRYFYKFDEFVLIETNTVIKLTFFLIILRYQSLKSLLVYQYLLLSRFFLVKTGKIPSFLHIVGSVLYIFGYKAAFVEILSMKTGLMHASVGRSTLRGIPFALLMVDL